ncbi:hypothetical protein ABIE26_002638 [Pedobacter africanus]|uniref:Uncharacterized protein n=1 Tax=Pedobacter africanus TaxID=151894 RepID=A0ACC6KX60_9SPHI|nr:hypothetical protein [Pedobacter africanus]
MPEGGEYDNLKAICDYLSRLGIPGYGACTLFASVRNPEGRPLLKYDTSRPI